MADAATNSPPSTELDMESLHISKPKAAEDQTPPKTPSGLAGHAIETCSMSGCSSHLSAGEAQRLARITRDRRNGWMVSVVDVDFLLDVIGRMGS